jgi:hypothetical protein
MSCHFRSVPVLGLFSFCRFSCAAIPLSSLFLAHGRSYDMILPLGAVSYIGPL